MPRVAESGGAHGSDRRYSENETSCTSMPSNDDFTATDVTYSRHDGRRGRQSISSAESASSTSGHSVDGNNQNRGVSLNTSSYNASPVRRRGARGDARARFIEGDVGSTVSDDPDSGNEKAAVKVEKKKKKKKKEKKLNDVGSKVRDFWTCKKCWRWWNGRKGGKGYDQGMSRAERDRRSFEKVRERLRAWGERSTFHGVDVLMETPADWRRVVVFLLLCLMTALCWLCCGRMILGFLNMSVTTVIDRDMEEFRFPAVTVCPDSPFSMAQLEAEASAFEEYKKIAEKWMKESPNTSTPDPQTWPQYEGQWRRRTKYSFFSTYAKTPSLRVPWSHYFVACQYNGRACPELHGEEVGVQLVGVGSGEGGTENADKDGVYVGNSHWTLDPGRIYGYADASGNTSEGLRTASRIANRTAWPKVSPVVIVTTAQYQCFQIRMKIGGVKRSGSKAGLHLILRRPYRRNETHPALLHVDADASIYQGWDDHQGTASTEDVSLAAEMDGFQVLLHTIAGNDQSVLSAARLASTGDARSVVRTSVRYGQHLVVTLSQFIHQRLDTYFRPCKKNIHPILYLDVEAFVREQKRRAVLVEYTRSNCVAALRQSVLQRRCGCLSESAMVPLYLADHLVSQGFCHDDRANHSAVVDCHDRVLRMSDEEVLDASIPRRWYRVVLVKLKPRTRHFWLCPQPCVERVNDIAHQQVTMLAEGLQAELLHKVGTANASTNLSSSQEADGGLTKSDYLVVSVAPEYSRIAVRSEGEAASFFNLLAALGGIFGLFLGLSGVTLFEVLESYYILLSQGFGTFRHAAKVGTEFGKKILTRRKSSATYDYDDYDGEEEEDEEGAEEEEVKEEEEEEEEEKIGTAVITRPSPPPHVLQGSPSCTDWDAAARRTADEIREYLSHAANDQRPFAGLPAYRCVKNLEGKWNCSLAGPPTSVNCPYPMAHVSAVAEALPLPPSSSQPCLPHTFER